MPPLKPVPGAAQPKSKVRKSLDTTQMLVAARAAPARIATVIAIAARAFGPAVDVPLRRNAGTSIAELLVHPLRALFSFGSDPVGRPSS